MVLFIIIIIIQWHSDGGRGEAVVPECRT